MSASGPPPGINAGISLSKNVIPVAPAPSAYVLMTADADCLEKRCIERNYRPGFGRRSLTAVDRLPHSYDLTLDSGGTDAHECAALVAASWRGASQET